MTDENTSLLELLEREQLPRSLLKTIQSVYEPIAERIATVAGERTPLIVGICGPQGSGKSTLTSILRVLLNARGRSVAALSIDDLYLTRAERARLAAEIHPLLRTRGVPGTHDVELGLKVLDALEQSGVVAVPSFDKATDDRRHESTWPQIQAPVDIVLFEGWCVGAQAQAEFALTEPINDLERIEDTDGRWRRYVNHALATQYQSLFARIALLIFLHATSFEIVFKWRAQQEEKLRERAPGGARSAVMNDTQLRRFIAHYERLTRHLIHEMPHRADILIQLNEERIPTRVTC